MNLFEFASIYSRRGLKKIQKRKRALLAVTLSSVFLVGATDVVVAKYYDNRKFVVDKEIQPMKDLWKNIYLNESNQLILHDKRAYSTMYSTIGSSKQIIPELSKLDAYRMQIRKNEVLSKLPSHKREVVSQNMKMTRGQIDRFKRSVVRSGKYLPEFKRVFKSYGLPEDLVYLPHVESSFTVKAVSNAGAAGLWQFMPGTGKQYGLRIDQNIDERYDPFFACDAAARLLRDNYELLGSWPLAITAYNHGANGMKKASAQYNTFGKIVHNYKSNSFGFYSKNYYPQFLASVEVAKLLETHLKRHMYNAEKLNVHVVDSPTSVENLIRTHKLTTDEFYSMNPAIKNKNKNFILTKGTRVHLKRVRI